MSTTLVPAIGSTLRPTDVALAKLGQTDATLLATFLSTIANDNTRDAYRRDVAAFVGWLDGHAAGRPWSLTDVSHVAAENWAREQTAAGFASATIARRQAALCRFFRWGSRPGNFNEGRPNPFSGDLIDRVKASSVHTSAIMAADVKRLLEVAGEGPHPVRDRALVLLMATTGLRVSEVCGASNGDLEKVGGACELIVRGKGGKVRRVPMLPALCDVLGDGPADGPLVANNDGGRLSRDQVERILTRLARRAGIPHLTPHMLRATAITEALGRGNELWAVQDLAGHSDPRTTRDYQRRRQGAEARAAMAADLYASFVES